MKLRHLSLPGLTPYTHASRLQDVLVRALLASKADPSLPIPPPTVLTAQFLPVYTCGRREIGTVDAKQQGYLRADGRAEFHEALRGGQTTFHGPGQLIAYPVIDLKRHALTPRCYVNLLEQVLIGTCGRYGISAMRTEHTGVWTSSERKIAAIGVHLRRNVTSHGIGLNVNTDLWWFGRIVACGLADKETTSFEREGVRAKSLEEVGGVFVQELVARLKGVEGVERIEETDLAAQIDGDGQARKSLS
jgi:lipoyl(octanoyl) transferase 2